MGKIAVLDKNTIDKIAAGEVVERPASIVKELVENAIDAGATAVTVEIKEGGISFIRITDNGCGIAKDQVRLAFLRHATSKIRSVEDLTQIASLGFRGEALSSIAAVSQVELITKTSGDLTGVRYVIEGGEEKSYEEIGAPEGTTFLIRNLFYNTPARSKFLKTATTEGNAVAVCVEQMALSNPHISFKYMQNGQTKLHTSGSRNVRELVYHIYGRDISRELIEVSAKTDLMEVSGFIAKPAVSRGNRNFENYYVNGRYVRSKLLSKAIEDGYHGFMMQHKYPFTLLYITMDGERVDVNVHPAKMELRFSSQEQIYNQLVLLIKDTLMRRERIPEVTLEGESAPEKQGTPISRADVPEPFEQQRRTHTFERQVSRKESLPVYPSDLRKVTAAPGPAGDKTRRSDGEHPPVFREASVIRERVPEKKTFLNPAGPEITESGRPQAEQEITKPTEEKLPEDPSAGTKEQRPAAEQMELFDGRLLSREARSSHKIIGQIFDTYWLVQYDDSLYIIDQHAAHEKVLYERMMKDFKEKQITSQLLSPPVIVTLQNHEIELLERYADLFANFGFEIEPFGGKEYQISAVPDNLYGVASDQLFLEILDSLEDSGGRTLDVISEKLASMSCKAAVKGNHRLSAPEIESLIDELLTLENPYNCPHGRPTIISMSRYELEKKFKRIV